MTRFLRRACWGFDSNGSDLSSSRASFLARVSRSKSSMMFAILKSGRPCCRVLKNSPGPRSLRSCSAILKPSLVLTMISRRLCAVSFSVSEKSRQYASCFPRPMRPRSWWSWASPNRSACSMTITAAFGMSRPTSITTVETSICILPDLKSFMMRCLSADFIRP